MAFVLAFYAIAVLAVLGTALGVYLLLARHSRLLGAGIAGLVLTGLVLLWPIPIHGGFTVLAEVIYRELEHSLTQWGQRQTRAKRAAFATRMEARFAGPLDLNMVERMSQDWYRVQTRGGSYAWYDAGTGLVFSDWLGLDPSPALPSLDAAKERCRTQSPEGYWALISEPENFLLWRAGERSPLPPAPASTVSYLVDESLDMEMPTYALRGSADNTGSLAPRRFVVRCVARTTAAPAGGYVRLEIPLEEWNRYQLSKGSG